MTRHRLESVYEKFRDTRESFFKSSRQKHKARFERNMRKLFPDGLKIRHEIKGKSTWEGYFD